jgi:nicotinic acid mononucleotide adenylyltransferase
VITSASTYLDKVSWYKQRCKDLESIVFVIGADTWDRLRDSVRYNGISQDMLYDFFSGNNVNFLVFNRHNKLTTDDKWDKLIIDCQDARLFNNSLSSTEIRVVV